MSSLLLKNGLIFDGHSPELIADKWVLVEDGRIVSINDQPDKQADRTIDVAGKVIMPGLIDAHFHAYATEASFVKLAELPISYIAQRGRHLVEAALRRGFTSIRDAGGADYGLWRAVEEGYVKGPRIFYSDKALSQTGGHADVREAHIEPCGCSLRGHLGQVVDGVDQVRKVVREILRQGAHQIKIMVSGGISTPTDPVWMLQFSEEEIMAAVDEASRRRTYVMAHAYTSETIIRAIRCGVRSIEHANLINREAADAVANSDAFVVPTLVSYDAIQRDGKSMGMPQTTLDKLGEVKEEGLHAVEICREAGVNLGFGTDLLGDMHRDQLRELAIRNEVDSPFQVLHSATGMNARLLQRENELGCVREGAFADLLIVDGNPLEDLSLLYREDSALECVIKGGEVVLEP